MHGRLGSTRLKVLAMVMDGHKKKRPVTYRQMAANLGMNINAVVGHIRRLERDGLVAREPFLTRTLVPTCKFVEV